MHVRNEFVRRPSPGRGGGEEEGAPLLHGQPAANVGAAPARAEPSTERRLRRAPGRAGLPPGPAARGRGWGATLSPRAAPGQSRGAGGCRCFPSAPISSAVPGRGSWPCREKCLGVTNSRVQRVNRKGGRDRPSTGTVVGPCPARGTQSCEGWSPGKAGAGKPQR